MALDETWGRLMIMVVLSFVLGVMVLVGHAKGGDKDLVFRLGYGFPVKEGDWRRFFAGGSFVSIFWAETGTSPLVVIDLDLNRTSVEGYCWKFVDYEFATDVLAGLAIRLQPILCYFGLGPTGGIHLEHFKFDCLDIDGSRFGRQVGINMGGGGRIHFERVFGEARIYYRLLWGRYSYKDNICSGPCCLESIMTMQQDLGMLTRAGVSLGGISFSIGGKFEKSKSKVRVNMDPWCGHSEWSDWSDWSDGELRVFLAIGYDL